MMKCQCQECGQMYKFVKRSEVSHTYCPKCEDIYLRMLDELSYPAVAESMLEDPAESCDLIAEFFGVNSDEVDAVSFVLNLSTEEVAQAVVSLFGPEYTALFGQEYLEKLRKLQPIEVVEPAEEDPTPLILCW